MTIPWQRIQNRKQLLSNGPINLRTHTVDIIEYAIRAAQYFRCEFFPRESIIFRQLS